MNVRVCLFYSTTVLMLCSTTAYAATVNINPIRVCDDDGNDCAPVNYNLAYTNKIMAQSGTTLSFGPLRQYNSTKYLTPTAAEASELISSTIFSGTQRQLLAYDMWFVQSIDNNAGFRGLGALGGDGTVISASAAVDTLAHELGHNFGYDHTADSTIDQERYLMAAGSVRDIPVSLGEIAPDGKQLSRFDPILPEITVDTIGATPFASNNFFDVKFLSGAATDLGLKSLTIDLSPAGAFFDVTNAPPGFSGSTFGYGVLSGISSSDITVTGLFDGSSALSLGFAADSFTSGDLFSFGLDIDLFANIDGFGATPDELRSVLVSLNFENGFSKSGTLADQIFSSIFDPNENLDVQAVAFGDPVGNLPAPIPLPAGGLLLLSGMMALLATRRAARSSNGIS